MSIANDERRGEPTEERRPLGCGGCSLIVLACLALDAATIFVGYQIVMLVRGITVG